MRLLVVGLAAKDARHEKRLFLCFAAALAAVLAPLVVLMGLKQGVMTALRQELVENPRTRELLNIGNRSFDSAWFDRMRARPDVEWVVPRTRSIAATIFLERGDRSGAPILVELAPTAPRDPLLAGTPEPREGALVLSESAAQKLAVTPGESVVASAVRTLDGTRQRASRDFGVNGIAPASSFVRDGAFAPLSLLLAVEDYLDGRVADIDRAAEGNDRVFAGFRMYARRIEDVGPLAAALAADGVETRTRAEDIESVLLLDRNLTIIFLIVAAIGTVGYAVSLGASLWANVERKRRDLALIRLLGLTSAELVAFPVLQSLLIALAGILVAGGAAAIVALAVNRLYLSGMPPGRPVCLLTPPDLALMAGVTLACAVVASALAAARAARIPPAEGLRDV